MSNKPIEGDQVIKGDLYIGGSIKKVDDIEASQISPVITKITEKTPVNAVAASGKMVSTGTLASDGETVTIGTTVYTLKTALSADPAVPYEVLLGANTGETATNLVAAITYDAGLGTNEGVLYGTGTEAHPDVTAEVTDSDDVTITASVKGTAGNAIATEDDSDQISWADAETTLVDGVDGTLGVANELCADGSYLYHCIAANTIADANWRRVTLGTAY